MLTPPSDYRKIRHLGSGASGEAWLYSHRHHPVVVKQVDFDPVASPEKARKLVREIQNLRKTTGHPNLVSLRDCWVVGDSKSDVSANGGSNVNVEVGSSHGNTLVAPRAHSGASRVSHTNLNRVRPAGSSQSSFGSKDSGGSTPGLVSKSSSLASFLNSMQPKHLRSYNIAMEYANGNSLQNYIEARHQPFSSFEAFSLFYQLVLGLKFLHREKRLLHRDLKPENILLSVSPFCKEGDDITVHDIVLKIADLGSAEEVSSPELTQVEGTASYLSPELCQGFPADERSDLWALGCIYYELLTLKPLFYGDSLGAIVMAIVQTPDLSLSGKFQVIDPPTRRILSGLLERDPERRIRDTETLEEMLPADWKFRAITNFGLRWP